MNTNITNNNLDFFNEISNFVFAAKYARYDETKKRRETWSEAVDRLYDMHHRKFSHLSDEAQHKISWAFDMVRNKYVVPSMRSLQFGGKAIEVHNARLYNCGAGHVSDIRFFAEAFYLLLCGVGVTFGINKKYMSRLPNLVGPNDKTGTVITYIVEDTIEGWADSVEVLLSCYFKNTAMSGRKIVFDYSKIRKKGSPLKVGGGKAPGYKGLKNCHIKIKQLLDHMIEECNQSRMKTINAYDILMHCADAVLSGGIRRAATAVIFDYDDEDMMNSKTFFNVQKHKRFSFDSDTGLHYGKVQVNNKWYDVEIYQYDYDMLLNENKISWFYIEPQRARSNNSVLLLVNKVKKENIVDIIQKTKQFGEPNFVFAPKSPDTLFNPCLTGDTKVEVMDFEDNMRTMELAEVVQRVLSGELLYALSQDVATGERSYQLITGGDLTIRDAEVLAISTEDGNIIKCTPEHKFWTKNRGWVLAVDLNNRDILEFNGIDSSKVVDISVAENIEDVYDISVNNNSNFFANNVLVHNCFEVSFIPVTADGRCGIQFCNLSSINGAKVTSLETWKECVEAATIIGTLQAAYTDFPYLNNASKELTEEEALLGVSITGFMDNPDILLDESNQQEMARHAIDVNREWSKLIGVNPAARITLVKPEGTSSLVLGSASGAHPHHAREYIRRIQCNKIDPVYKHFSKFNPHTIEESVWSANKTDDVVSFPLTVENNVIVKKDLSAIQHLEIIKKIQMNWVNTGTTKYNKKPIRHNTSCTVVVKDSEWDDVIDYLYENRNHFAAVSLISDMGDKIYKQPPLETVDSDNREYFEKIKSEWKSVDYTMMYEGTDNTKQSQTAVCSGNQCEIKSV